MALVSRSFVVKALEDFFNKIKELFVSSVSYSDGTLRRSFGEGPESIVTAETIVTDGGGIKSHQTVSNKNATLAWGAATTVATVGSTDINVSLPANPNTNTTYTLSAGSGTNANKIVLTPSSGTAQVVIVPYATSADKLNTDAGSATNPVYFSGGIPVACTYSLNKTVPANAMFTDTTYSSKSASAGGTDISLVTTGEKYTWNNKGTYSKPSGGIPKTDLASAVQTSLGKADTALQSVSVVDSSPTLSWGGTSQIATIAGTGISVKMPSNPATGKADASTTVTNVSYNSGTGKLQKTINGSTTDITSIITSHQSVSSTTPAATWGASVQVGTVGGTGLGFVMPANPATGKADKNGSSSEDFSAALLSATSLKGGVRILDNSGSGASIQVEDSFIIFSKVQGASVSLPSGSNGQTHLLITTNGGTLYGPIGAMGPSDMRIFYGNGIGMYTSPSLGFSAGEVFFLAYGDGYWNVIQIVQM